MSILNQRFQGKDADDKDHPAVSRGLGLRQAGPIVQVTLSLLDRHRKDFSDLGKSLPASVSGYAMIDTGAGSTCVDRGAAQKAELMVVGRTNMTSATGTEEVSVYAGQLEIGGFASVTAETAFGAKLDALGLIALIGRDVLADCILVYNGLENSFSLSN